jgi:hypothetical protein
MDTLGFTERITTVMFSNLSSYSILGSKVQSSALEDRAPLFLLISFYFTMVTPFLAGLASIDKSG